MQLPVGESDFESIIDNNFNFVDKSLFIRDIIQGHQVTLITRPRRFGKTLNLSMLRYFFSAEVDGKPTKALFDNLAINKAVEICSKHQGKHPVVSFSFKDIKKDTFDKAYGGIANKISAVYNQYRYLLDSNSLAEEQKTIYRSILEEKATEIHLSNSLMNLTTHLHRHHRAKVVVLIDEYDTPIQSGYLHGYYDEIIDFFRGFFGAGLKDNPYIFRGVLTGILRVSKENLFSGANNLVSYSMLDEQYSPYFGFTEREVERLLAQAGMTDQLDEVRRWYNGYRMGEATIYNPWSIANYFNRRDLQPYWVNTSDNALIKNLLINSNGVFKDDFEHLLKDGSICHVLDDTLVFSDLNLNNPSALWDLFYMAGYLKVDSCKPAKRGIECTLSVPNKEILNLYEKIVAEWLSEGKNSRWYDTFIQNLLDGDVATFTNDLQSIMEQVISVHDTARDPEAFYHGLIIGLTAALHNDENYELRSNRESGKGRYDYLIISRNPEKLSILMEFKRTDSPLPRKLKKAAKVALKQIDLKHYIIEAKQRGIKKLLRIGIAFSGKHFALESAITELSN